MHRLEECYNNLKHLANQMVDGSDWCKVCLQTGEHEETCPVGLLLLIKPYWNEYPIKSNDSVELLAEEVAKENEYFDEGLFLFSITNKTMQDDFVTLAQKIKKEKEIPWEIERFVERKESIIKEKEDTIQRIDKTLYTEKGYNELVRKAKERCEHKLGNIDEYIAKLVEKL